MRKVADRAVTSYVGSVLEMTPGFVLVRDLRRIKCLLQSVPLLPLLFL
jgi:hypothetical protein